MLRYAEMGLAAFAFLILTGTHAYYFMVGVPPGVTAEELTAFEGKIRNVFTLAYLIVAGLAVVHWRKMVLGIAAVWPIALLIAVAWLSNFWTVAPEVTYRRCIALTVTTLMGVYLFARFDLTTLLRFLVFVAAVMIIGCIAWAVLLPAYGLHNDGAHAGVWRGIFFHKNMTGRFMVYCLVIIIAAWVSGAVHRTLLFGLGMLALLVIAGTTSQTTLLATLVLLAGLIAVRMVQGQAVKSALVTLVVLAIAWHGVLFAMAGYEIILQALGRDASLTGRTEIWAYTLQYALKQPLTGYGYDAFWNGELSPGAQYAEYWNTPHSHNSWLELFIALGLPGVILMATVMLLTLGRGIMLARYYPNTTPATLIMLMCFAMLTVGMAEPIFIEKHTLDWLLLVMIAGTARALTSSLGEEPAIQAATSPQRRLPEGAGALRSYPT